MTSKSDDKVQEYAKEVMILGMFYLNYKDAIKEGDGGRVLTLWKYCQYFAYQKGETIQLRSY